MCLIAHWRRYNPKVNFLTPEDQFTCEMYNRDGTGFMTLHEGRVVTGRDVDNPEAIYNAAEAFTGRSMAIHWRMATHGPVSPQNTHPFHVMNVDWGDPYDLALMHNGVFSGLGTRWTSDTAAFVHALRVMLKKSPELIRTNEFRTLVNMAVGDHSKVLMLGSHKIGWLSFPKLKAWYEYEKGVHVSNTYSLYHAPKTSSTKLLEVNGTKWFKPEAEDEAEAEADDGLGLYGGSGGVKKWRYHEELDEEGTAWGRWD